MAFGLGDYKNGLQAGVMYTSGSWQGPAGSDYMYNYDTQNIGNSYLELWRNGVGLWTTNYPGVFLYSGQSTGVSYCCPASYSSIGKCKSSNTRPGAGCGLV